MKKRLILIAGLAFLLVVSAIGLSQVKTGDIIQMAQAADAKLSQTMQAEKDKELRSAAQKGLTAKVSSLLASGANKNSRAKNGRTALMFATNPQVVKILLAAGANTEVKENEFEMTALILATAQDNAEIVKLLLDAGANVEARTNNNFTPLLLASVSGNVEIMKLLIKAGANIDARAGEGATCLMLAACEGNIEAVKLLLESGASTEARDDHGYTALMTATEEGKTDVVNLLQGNSGASAPSTASEAHPFWDIGIILLQQLSQIPILMQQNNVSSGAIQTYNTPVQNSTSSEAHNNRRLDICESGYSTCKRGCSSAPSFGNDISGIRDRCYARCASNRADCVNRIR